MPQMNTLRQIAVIFKILPLKKQIIIQTLIVPKQIFNSPLLIFVTTPYYFHTYGTKSLDRTAALLAEFYTVGLPCCRLQLDWTPPNTCSIRHLSLKSNSIMKNLIIFQILKLTFSVEFSLENFKKHAVVS